MASKLVQLFVVLFGNLSTYNIVFATARYSNLNLGRLRKWMDSRRATVSLFFGNELARDDCRASRRRTSDTGDSCLFFYGVSLRTHSTTYLVLTTTSGSSLSLNSSSSPPDDSPSASALFLPCSISCRSS